MAVAEIIYDDAGKAIAQLIEIAGKVYRQPPPPETRLDRRQLREQITKARTVAELRDCLLQLAEMAEKEGE